MSSKMHIASHVCRLISFIERLLGMCIDFLQSYNGSQLWDTSFAVQAFISTELTEEYGSTLRKAHTYIKNSQVKIVLSSRIFIIICFCVIDLRVISCLNTSDLTFIV